MLISDHSSHATVPMSDRAAPRSESARTLLPATAQPQAERRPSLVINALSNWAALGTNVIVGLLLTPFVIAHLGKTGYGIWTLIGSIVGYHGLLQMGVGSAVGRYVARYVAQKDYRAVNGTISTALAIFSLVGLVMLLVSVISGTPLARFFDLEAAHIQEFRYILILLVIGSAIGLLSQVFWTALTAHELFVARNSFTILTTLIRAGLIVWMLRDGFGLLGVCLAHVICSVIKFAAAVTLCRILTPSVHPRPAYVSWSVVGTLFSFGVPIVFLGAAHVLRFNVASVVIGKLIGLESVAVYAIAALIARYFMQAIHSGVGVLTPRFSALDAIGDHQALQDLFLRSLRVSSVLAFGGTAVLLLGARPFVAFWVGDDFLGAIKPLYVLVFVLGFALAQAPGVTLLVALAKHRYLAVLTIPEALANLILSICLARSYGILGVAMGTALPMLVVKLIAQPMYTCKVTSVSIGQYYRAMLLGIVLAVPLVGVVWAMGVLN